MHPTTRISNFLKNAFLEKNYFVFSGKYCQSFDLNKINLDFYGVTSLSIYYTGCFESLGHILTMNISETIKDIKTHLVNSESL